MVKLMDQYWIGCWSWWRLEWWWSWWKLLMMVEFRDCWICWSDAQLSCLTHLYVRASDYVLYILTLIFSNMFHAHINFLFMKVKSRLYLGVVRFANQMHNMTCLYVRARKYVFIHINPDSFKLVSYKLTSLLWKWSQGALCLRW